MHIAISAEFDGRPLALESDVYLVTEDGRSYLCVEQNGPSVYVADHMLFPENGKAFKIGDKLQAQAASYRNLLAHIGALYEALKITAEEAEMKQSIPLPSPANRWMPFWQQLPVGKRCRSMALKS